MKKVGDEIENKIGNKEREDLRLMSTFQSFFYGKLKKKKSKTYKYNVKV